MLISFEFFTPRLRSSRNILSGLKKLEHQFGQFSFNIKRFSLPEVKIRIGKKVRRTDFEQGLYDWLNRFKMVVETKASPLQDGRPGDSDPKVVD
ncbi:MAG: hypothetical protein VCD34_07350, partial [Planctomycetota bacterium]